MKDNDTRRLSRLAAILTQLQTRRLLTASELADRFLVSKRTIYRDIKALEEADIPVVTVEGKGYSLMEGYRVPPVMFTESEANALITAEQLVLRNKDASFVSDYSSAISKIKAILRSNEKANLLSERTLSGENAGNVTTSNHLSVLQLALTNFKLVHIRYISPDNPQPTERTVEPFAIYTAQENWLLVAFCRLRNDFRAFRLDRIESLEVTLHTFEPHKITFEEYFQLIRKKC